MRVPPQPCNCACNRDLVFPKKSIKTADIGFLGTCPTTAVKDHGGCAHYGNSTEHFSNKTEPNILVNVDILLS